MNTFEQPLADDDIYISEQLIGRLHHATESDVLELVAAFHANRRIDAADGSSWPILLQKSAGSVGAIFSGPRRCPSKKHVGVHSTDHSHHKGLSQPLGDAFGQRFHVAPALASIFIAPNFSTFATESARVGPTALCESRPLSAANRPFRRHPRVTGPVSLGAAQRERALFLHI
jgi:hypothetical protein